MLIRGYVPIHPVRKLVCNCEYKSIMDWSVIIIIACLDVENGHGEGAHKDRVVFQLFRYMNQQVI